MLQACLNGGRGRRDHPAVPLTPAQLARDAAAVRRAGAETLHVHPRDARGRETLLAEPVAEALRAIRSAVPGMPVGISTGAWIDTGGLTRLEAMRDWTELPDYVSVNLHEADAPDVIGLMRARGVGIESGLANRAAAARFMSDRFPRYSLRALVEISTAEAAAAPAEAEMILGDLRRGGVSLPILLHGEGVSVWPMVRMAAERGYHTRVGFEDGCQMPGGAVATGNAVLVAAARAILDAAAS